jgi:predicted CXXCH cytochrome family protein
MITRRVPFLKLLIIIAACLTFLAGATNAMAAAMPTGHGMFSNNARICVVCHRTHTATNGNLLRVNAGLCQTCHSGGAGADTDISSGHYVNSPSDPNNWGTVGDPLLGGGFADINGAPMAYPGTSQHKIGGDPATPFGSASGATMILTCTSCHTIHAGFSGGAQYRLLRLSVGDAAGPLNVTWNGPWEGPAQASPHNAAGYMAYTETLFGPGLDNIADPRPKEFTRNYNSGVSDWCVGCHSNYTTYFDGSVKKIKHTVEVPLSGSPTTKLNTTYGLPETDLPLNDKIAGGDTPGRSPGDTLNCLTCHKAHGTTALMDRMAVIPASGRATDLPVLTGSMLLRMDNRGVCVNCHRNLWNSSY